MIYLTERKGGLFVPSLIFNQSLIVHVKLSLGQIVLLCSQRNMDINCSKIVFMFLLDNKFNIRDCLATNWIRLYDVFSALPSEQSLFG